jgi:superfamily II DNA/RNA helicase
MTTSANSPEEIALDYLGQLPFPPYSFQEQAILSWFEESDGLLVCAPTGSGKTVIAETAMYEALRTGRRAYYTTPLIALTDQKFRELQESAVRWGFSAEDVGLVTGNRRINPDARILVVVAEILLNRLLSPEEFSFSDVSAIVMDEFHSFNDVERGIVWELSLGMLPKHVRVLLISATVGNAPDFVAWLARQHQRRLRLLQSQERRVPLTFQWIGDQMLDDQLELMADGDEASRYTPALVFCFNRNECWSVAEQLKGRRLLADGQQKQLQQAMESIDWTVGAGGKLKQILLRGVGIHHAGLLPRYRRVVEHLFQKKLLSVCICTETLAAGINLPARSVVMTSLLKGPPGRMKVIETSSAHQMFGRAGRPQFDSRGFVFAVAHEDDVRLFRWQEKYDAIPEDTRDPMLLRAKKNLKKKMPKRRDGQQYWTERQFQMLRDAPPGKLASRGRFPWRLLAFLIRKSGSVFALTEAVRRRLLDSDQKDDAEKNLKRMLLTMQAAGFIQLSPPPAGELQARSYADTGFQSRLAGTTPADLLPTDGTQWSVSRSVWAHGTEPAETLELGEIREFASAAARQDDLSDFGDGIAIETQDDGAANGSDSVDSKGIGNGNDTPAGSDPVDSEGPEDSPSGSDCETTNHHDDTTRDHDDQQSSQGTVNETTMAVPEAPVSGAAGLLGRLIQEARVSGTTASTSRQAKTPVQKAAPLRTGYSSELLDSYEPQHAAATDQLSLLFAFRSVNPIYAVYIAEHLHRAAYEERLQLMEAILDMPRSVAMGVRVPFPDRMPPGPMAVDYLNPLVLSRGLATTDELNGYRDEETGRRIPPLALADKMRLAFRSEYSGIDDVASMPVWCVGDLLSFGGNFDRYVRTRDLTKQEGIVFRHCLKMILLCGEFSQIEPPGIPPAEWRRDLSELAGILTESCRLVDPDSTDEVIDVLQHQTVNPDQLT